MQWLIDRVTCCVVLHNMLLGESVPPEWLHYDEDDADNEELEENNPLMQPTMESNQQREQLCTYMVERGGRH